MSFLIDPPWLYATGRAYRRLQSGQESMHGERDGRMRDGRVRDGRMRDGSARDAVVAATTMALFLGVSVSLYQDRRWTTPIWRACNAESGRDWMLNSGVFKFDWRKAGPRTHRISAAIFATYPLWLWLGMRRSRR
jgi:hypothetical protein